MKHTILALLCIGFFATGQAQEISKDAIEATASQLIADFQLTPGQEEKAFEIAERQLKNLQEIQPLEAADQALFLQKKNAIRQGTWASIRQMLTDNQMPAYKAQLVERRKRESALIQQLKKEGASQKEIQLAVWALD